ncbi:hypothetical protein N185_34450 [Sinorhizobium sp. GW3]|nr:hypothetical protein N185_34450 [Sinorhizobium sp. GW3]
MTNDHPAHASFAFEYPASRALGSSRRHDSVGQVRGLPHMIFEQGAILSVVIVALLLGGIFKGVSGMGLPLIALPVMAIAIPVPTAVSILSVPVLLSNVVQVREGSGFRRAVKRFWPLLLGLCAGIIVGAPILVLLSQSITEIILGVVLLAFLCSEMLTFAPAVPARYERVLGAGVGFFGGLVGGLTTLFGPPLIVFLSSLRLSKDDFIPALGLCYLTGCSALYLILIGNSVLGSREAAMSLAAVLPVIIGMRIGRWLRDRLNQRIFMIVVRLSLTFIGASLVLKNLPPLPL